MLIRSWSIRIVVGCSRMSANSDSRLVWVKSSAVIPLACPLAPPTIALQHLSRSVNL
jgi:hypothetical protein